MIGMLHGQVDFIDAASAIIEVGGVGYETRMPSADLASMHAGQTVKVYTSLNVSQDAITLFSNSRGPSISVRSRGLPKRFVLRKMPVRNRSWKV